MNEIHLMNQQCDTSNGQFQNYPPFMECIMNMMGVQNIKNGVISYIK